MKVSIITLQNISNYGSVLQAYATQQFFKNLGYEVELIDYWRENMVDYNIADQLVENENLKLKGIWGRSPLLKKVAKYMLAKKIEMRAKPFRSFVHKYITTTSTKYLSIQELEANPPKADIYCVGSDQVWNSQWNGGLDKAFYLQFGDKNKPRISFSSSLGVEVLPQEEKGKIAEFLREFDMITVRESTAMNLIQSLGIKNVKTILDPTLTLSKSDWSKIVDSRYQKNGKYILIYQLNENSFFDKVVEEARKQTQCEVIRIEYHKSNKSGRHYVLPSIEEWVSLFYYAEYVITDSFHATAFSVNFEKKFIDVLPEKFSTRISSFLSLVGLENRRINKITDIKTLVDPINYNEIIKKLSQERDAINKLFEH